MVAGIACDEQRIVFAGRQLADDCFLASSGVSDEATLNVLARLAGGAKKRKKKTYTKPKKIKHKHKKVKLRVLKFYKVRSRHLGGGMCESPAHPTSQPCLPAMPCMLLKAPMPMPPHMGDLLSGGAAS